MKYVWGFLAVLVVVFVVASYVRELMGAFQFLLHPIDSTRAMSRGTMSGLAEGVSLASPILRYAGLVLAGVVVVVAGLLAIPVLLGLFRHKLIVFISYHHERAHELEQVRAAIVAVGASVRFVEYRTAADHDLVLDDIQKQIVSAHAVVCLPGEQSSFLDAEVFSAIGMKKLLIFIVDYPYGSLPNTAQKSFPVLRRKFSEKYQHAALGDLLLYLQGRPRAVLRNYVLPVSMHPFVARVLSVIMVAIAVVFALGILGSIVYAASNYFSGSSVEVQSHISAVVMICAVAVMFAILACLGIVALCLFLLSGLTVIHRRLRLLRVFKREIKEGQYVFQTIRRALGDGRGIQFLDEGGKNAECRPRWARRLLVCMWRCPPFAHHQR